MVRELGEHNIEGIPTIITQKAKLTGLKNCARESRDFIPKYF